VPARPAIAIGYGGTIHTYNLCLLGLGNVNRALVRLLQAKDDDLRQRGIGWRITGVASRRLGWLVNPDGFDPKLLTDSTRDTGAMTSVADLGKWLKAARADVLLEATSLEPCTGQPAIDYIRAALAHGAHAITANKGPVVHAYRELTELAAKRNKRFLFESTVMDGVPIFSMFRDSLPAVEVRGFRGILNSTTNVILSGIEQGLSFDQALKKAQDIGVAETDASHDIEGWDAAVKVAALVNVVMGTPIRIDEVEREGISALSAEVVRGARAHGKAYKLVCRANRQNGKVQASVRPEQLSVDDPLALVAGTSSIVYFETDMFPGLALLEVDPGVDATAYGMLADFVRAVASSE